MTTRTITQCDRCRVELTPATAVQRPGAVVTRGTDRLDLCGRCESKLENFLAGQELEEPP